MLTRRGFLSLIPSLLIRRRLLYNARGPLLLATAVAGYRFHDGPRVEYRFRRSDRLILRREPRNLYDARAVAVDYAPGVCIGYVPRACNEIPARLLDQGVELRAEIVTIARSPAPPWKRVAIDIRLKPE